MKIQANSAKSRKRGAVGAQRRQLAQGHAYAGTSYQINLAPTGAIASAQRAEGTLFVPLLDGNHNQKFSNGVALRATCGVTFISRTMAITASHCVSSPNVYDLDNQTFTVQMYRPTANLAWTNADYTQITAEGIESDCTQSCADPMNVNNLSLASWCDRQRSVDLLAANGGPARIVELAANNCAGCSPWWRYRIANEPMVHFDAGGPNARTLLRVPGPAHLRGAEVPCRRARATQRRDGHRAAAPRHAGAHAAGVYERGGVALRISHGERDDERGDVRAHARQQHRGHGRVQLGRGHGERDAHAPVGA